MSCGDRDSQVIRADGGGSWSGTTRGDRAFALLAGAVWLVLLCIGSFA